MQTIVSNATAEPRLAANERASGLFDSSFSARLMSWIAGLQRGGVKAVSVAPEEAEIRRAIRQLRAFSDAELRDMGITRGEIAHVVRFGRTGIEANTPAPTTSGPAAVRQVAEVEVAEEVPAGIGQAA